MPSPKVFVNYFVVLLNDYYINLRATTKSVFMALVGGLRGGGACVRSGCKIACGHQAMSGGRQWGSNGPMRRN
jgi:hypothetical protein